MAINAQNLVIYHHNRFECALHWGHEYNGERFWCSSVLICRSKGSMQTFHLLPVTKSWRTVADCRTCLTQTWTCHKDLRTRNVFFSDSLHTDLYTIHMRTNQTKVLESKICHRKTICKPQFVGWHNCEMFAASLQGRSRYHADVICAFALLQTIFCRYCGGWKRKLRSWSIGYWAILAIVRLTQCLFF